MKADAVGFVGYNSIAILAAAQNDSTTCCQEKGYMMFSSVHKQTRSTRSIKFALAALAASAVLSTGEARAQLSNTSAQCEAVGIDRFCTPSQTEALLDQVFIVNPGGGDELFTITADPTAIILNFDETVSGNELEGTGFFLRDIQNTENLSIEIVDVEYFGDFSSFPSTAPSLTNSIGGDGINRTEIEWTNLSGADPVGAEAVARINLAFVPEPNTGVLFGLGLAGLASVGRRRRR